MYVKRQVVSYVLYGDTGYHERELIKSIKSWKRFDPGIQAVLITDKETRELSGGCLDVVDKLFTECPFETYNHFYPKACLATCLSGCTEMIYLDTDTTVVQSLKPFFHLLSTYRMFCCIGQNCSCRDVDDLKDLPELPFYNAAFYGCTYGALFDLEHKTRRIIKELGIDHDIAFNKAVRMLPNVVGLPPTTMPRQKEFFRYEGPGQSTVWHSRTPVPNA